MQQIRFDCSFVVQEEIYAKSIEEAREIFRENLEDGALTDIDSYIDVEEGRHECELGGDESDCEHCAYGGNYAFNKENGFCEKRK